MLQLISLIIGFLLVHFKLFRPPRQVILACGIAGFSGARPVDITKLKWLLAENQSRGYDSTGVYGNHLYKDKVKAKEFILSKGFLAATKGAKTVQAHTRAATVGVVTADNAHPFMYGEGENLCIGAHNGFIVPELLPYYQDEADIVPKDFKMAVDSQILFQALAHTGDINVISRIDGGMAISFQFPNRNKDVLYLYRRENTRPLFIGEASDGLYYSSLDDVLKHIGCEAIFKTTPNTLYTLEKGQIIDMYKMPDPVLKSLAADVQRLSWRTGVPIAEINALPVNVGTQKTYNVSNAGRGNSNFNSKQLGFGNSWKNKHVLTSEENDGDSCNIRKHVSESYPPNIAKSTDTAEAKYKLLINVIKKELSVMDCSVLTPDMCSSRNIDDQNGCLLIVKLLNKDNNKPLMAWSVLADDDPEVSGITSPHGITVMKVPYPLCEKTMKIHVYDPIDQIGHFMFLMQPEAARVMEVTLSIPFRKEEKGEGHDTNNTEDMESPEACAGSGCVERNLHDVGTNIVRLHEPSKGSHSHVLRFKPGQILGGYSEKQVNGAQTTERYPNKLVPETTAGNVNLNELPKVQRQLIPTYTNKVEQLKIIDYLITVDNRGQYMNWVIPSMLWIQAVKSEHYQTWEKIYNKYQDILDVHSLIQDAARLQCWDRHQTKWWYKIHDYIECLLRNVSGYYWNEEYTKRNPWIMQPELYYPSTLLKNALQTKKEDHDKKKRTKRSIPFLDFANFCRWRGDFKIKDTMTTKSLRELQLHSDSMHEVINGLNEVLQKKEDTATADEMGLREKIIIARNWMINEKTDLDDFISMSQIQVNKKPEIQGPIPIS